MDGLGTFAEEYQKCVEIRVDRQMLKVLGLERMLASKWAAKRPKDQLTIPVMQDALTVQKTRKRSAKKR
jgi:hypothetical protein